MENDAITKLYVLYDPACGVCCRARDWMLAQSKFIEMKLVPAGSRAAREMFPELHSTEFDAKQQLKNLTVVDNLGGVYRGGEAWVMCFYALAGYRGLALRLADPELLPLACRAFSLISRSRGALSELLGMPNQTNLAEHLLQEEKAHCGTQSASSCAVVENLPQHALRVAHESWLW